ncbi:unnamed protein product [Callosobruchus maculatus]|uniref:Reverse transcriptase domain-containing protein n=1 Tax=Callosobruchus maculatus TaxID=64391 RepID=A0A653C3B2_CALMS|nr:unnamed protein product [Callosobruchus maculatus]
MFEMWNNVAAKLEVQQTQVQSQQPHTSSGSIKGEPLKHNHFPKYLGVTLDRTLCYKKHLANTAGKLRTRNNIIQKLCGTTWGATAPTLRTSALALVYSCAEYCAPVWINSHHTRLIDVQLNHTMRLITGAVKTTPTQWLPVLSGIAPPQLRRTDALLREYNKITANNKLPIHRAIPPLQINRLKSRQPPIRDAEGLKTNNFDSLSQWRSQWEGFAEHHSRCAFIGAALLPGSELPRKEWVKLNRVRTGHGRCADSLYKWGYVQSPLCDCGAPRQTINHITSECELRAFQGSREDFFTATPLALMWLKELDINL